MIITAKIRINDVQECCFGNPPEKYSENVQGHPVYSSDPADPNYSYSQATPSGSVMLTITNKSAFGAFVKDREYLVTFEPVA